MEAEKIQGDSVRAEARSECCHVRTEPCALAASAMGEGMSQGQPLEAGKASRTYSSQNGTTASQHLILVQ